MPQKGPIEQLVAWLADQHQTLFEQTALVEPCLPSFDLKRPVAVALALVLPHLLVVERSCQTEQLAVLLVLQLGTNQ